MKTGLFTPSELRVRGATVADIPAIKVLMQHSISRLQVGFLSPEQIEASRAVMGLDTQLIEDGTYFCVMKADTLVGCGGWSFRATLYGGNHSAGRDAARLDPATDRARIRAMYTHPDHARRGIGRLVIQAAEAAAKAAGFNAVEMAATLSGELFYKHCGYNVETRWHDKNGSVPIPLLTMVKVFDPA